MVPPASIRVKYAPDEVVESNIWLREERDCHTWGHLWQSSISFLAEDAEPVRLQSHPEPPSPMAQLPWSQWQRRPEAETALEEKLTQACSTLNNGSCKNITAAAKQFKVSYHTLHQCCKNLTVPQSHAHKNQQLLTDAQEEMMCHWVKYMALTGHPFLHWSLWMKAGKLSKKLKEKAKETSTVPMASW